MAEEFQYQKKRIEFGRHPNFEDTQTKIVGRLDQKFQEYENQYVIRNPNKVVLDNVPSFSEHRVSYTFNPHCRPITYLLSPWLG